MNNTCQNIFTFDLEGSHDLEIINIQLFGRAANEKRVRET